MGSSAVLSFSYGSDELIYLDVNSSFSVCVINSLINDWQIVSSYDLNFPPTIRSLPVFLWSADQFLVMVYFRASPLVCSIPKIDLLGELTSLY